MEVKCIPILFRWKLNGTEIHSKYGSHYILSGGNLRISRLNKDQDAGTYQCLASNSFGTIVSREASLTFACKSLLPTTLQANFSSFCFVEREKDSGFYLKTMSTETFLSKTTSV